MLAGLKTLLLVSEVFPQAPIKPLGLFTSDPRRASPELRAAHGPLNADLFLPGRAGKAYPGLVLAMGVKTADRDRPVIVKFAETLSRLGFAVLWPRSPALDEGRDLPEEPETFVEGFRYLAGLPEVDPARVSFFGFSVGSSLALVAAADPAITTTVRAVIFFGGFYDVDSYLLAVAAGLPGWAPAEDARKHFLEVLRAQNAHSLISVMEAGSPEEAVALLAEADGAELARLRRLSPSMQLDRLHAPLFILHDKGDTYVPYTESMALHQALAGRDQAFVLVDLFEHVQPNKPLTLRNLQDLFRLYGFIRGALAAIG